jgi:hypothetical protein
MMIVVETKLNTFVDEPQNAKRRHYGFLLVFACTIVPSRNKAKGESFFSREEVGIIPTHPSKQSDPARELICAVTIQTP